MGGIKEKNEGRKRGREGRKMEGYVEILDLSPEKHSPACRHTCKHLNEIKAVYINPSIPD